MSPTLGAVLALAALLLLPVGLTPSAPHSRLPASLGSGPIPAVASHPARIAGAASALEAARTSLAVGLGPTAFPFRGWHGGAMGPLSDPTGHPPIPGFGRSASSEGWSRLGSVDGHAFGEMAYDAADGYVLLFGGQPAEGSTWSFANGTWTNLSSQVTGAPPPRAEAGMTYDAALGSVVLFGGVGFLPNGTGVYRNDTWTYRAGVWTNITGSVGSAPEPRVIPGFAYDPNDSADVLFGGYGTHGVAAVGTWELTGGHWSNVTAAQNSSPPAIAAPPMAEDATDGDVVLVGADNASSPFGNSTWTFTGNRWTNVTASAGSAPSSRGAETLSTDSSLGGVVLWGGYGMSTRLPVGLSDTWQFVHGTWTRLTTNGTPPSYRGYELVADDPASAGVLLYGGLDEFNVSIYLDTWALSLDQWSLVTPGASPNPRIGTSMAYDSTTEAVILFGGSGGNDTWSYSHGVWTRLHPTRAPPGRVLATLTDDPSDHELVLFGGEALTGGLLTVTLWNDTWVWANGTWTNLTSTAQGPPARTQTVAAYDSTIGEVVLYGGLSRIGGFHDTWTFHGGRWTQVNTTGPLPYASYGMTLADDPAQSGVVLFGGIAVSGGCPGVQPYCRQTWTFSGTSWTNRTSTTAPSARAYAGLAYDGSFGEDILFGGISWVCQSTPNGSSCLAVTENDTWTYGSGGWTNITSHVGTAPTQTDGSAIAYDPSDGYLLLFGAFAGEYSQPGSGAWWALRSGATSGALTVGTPNATVNPVQVLQATTLAVSVTGGVPPYTLVWHGLPGGCSSANSTTVRCVPTTGGPYHITVVANDSTGATATSAALVLNVSVSPIVLGSVVLAPSAPSVSVGQAVNLTAEAFDTQGHSLSGATFAWTVAPTNLGSLDRNTGANVRFSANATAGKVAVQAAATFARTTVDGAATVTVFERTGQPLTIVSFSATPTTLAVGATVAFTAHVTGGTAPYTYTYSGPFPGLCVGEGPFLNCTTNAVGTFVLGVHVIDTNGTTATATATVSVTTGVASTSTGGLPVTLWIGIGALVVVGALVGTVLALRGRRRPPSAAAGSAP